jgi:hypothetical protein
MSRVRPAAGEPSQSLRALKSVGLFTVADE